MIDHEKIAALAQQYWEEEGRPHDRANEHWLRAEAELKQALESENSPLEGPPPSPPPSSTED
jgi:hypothetical protein